jgi:signal transduction histidine kinase
MRTRLRTLRWRVTLATTFLGATLSVLFAMATVFITEDYESLLITEILDSEAQDYTLALAANADAPLPQSHRLSGYLQRKDGTGAVPPDLLALSPGIHDEDTDIPDGVSVGVFDVEQGRLFFVIDLSDIEVLEQHLAYFLLAVVVLGTALAAWLGWLLSGLSVEPVRRLAAAVDALPVVPSATQLAAIAPRDDLGHLAAAIDGYQARLVEADAEERRFFADASHELRTPISVVRGVAELILDDPDIREEQRRWLGRLDRGMAELTVLLDVLLGLARGRELAFEDVPAHALVAESIATLRADGSPGAWEASITLPGHWRLPPHEARLVLQGVLRRLVGTASGGRIEATQADGRLSLTCIPMAGDGTHRPLEIARGDTGMGMTLVNRLATLLGWRIDYVVGSDGARTALITL